MPPIRAQSSRNSTEQEGRLLLAIQAIKNQEISSVHKAVCIYKVSETTLHQHCHGIRNRAISHTNSHKLTEIEEQSLQKWIISLDDCGAAPRPSTIQETANLLLKAHRTTPVQTVREKWVYNFMKRHPELSTQFSRHYNYEHAKCEDPKIIGEWFNLVQKTILQYGINPNNIYNFDETSFVMGLTVTVKVITRAEYYGQ